jgi:hypothetical protein
VLVAFYLDVLDAAWEQNRQSKPSIVRWFRRVWVMLLVHGEQNNNKKSSVSHYMPLVLTMPISMMKMTPIIDGYFLP